MLLQGEIIKILLILSTLISIGVSYFLVSGKKSSSTSIFLSLMLVSCAAWNFTIWLMLSTGNQIFLPLPFTITALIPAFTVLLVISFSGKYSRKSLFIALTPAFLMMALTFIPHKVIASYTVNNSNIIPGAFGPIYYIFFVYFLVYLVFDFYFFSKALKESTGIRRLQLIYMVLGFALAALFGTMFNLILPLFGLSGLSNVGPIFILAVVSATAYAIEKHYLFDPSVVLSELWALLLLLIGLVWLLLNLQFFNVILFVLIASICFLFINSVVRSADKNLELKRKKRQLEKDKQALQELDKMKDDFLKMSTHELNTPVVVIQGKMSMIFDENLGSFSKEQKDFLRPVFNNSSRLVKLFKEVLEALKLDQGKEELLKMETNINETFEKIIEKMRKVAEVKGQELIFLKTNISKLLIDPIKVQEVLINLLENAIKFAPKDGKIVVSMSISNNELVVSVSDNGVGISEADKRYIFEKFFQAKRFDPENPLEQQGAGLGLYISKKYIEAHGGVMWFESNEGIGSKFIFSLPIKN